MFNSYISFYLFNILSILLVINAFMVIFSNHTVYSLLYLVVCFFISSCLLFILDCELLALLFIIIYVGAIAVLFLFAIMMVEYKFLDLFLNSTRYFPLGFFFISGLLLLFLIEINISFPYFAGKSTRNPENSYYSYDHVLVWVSHRVGRWKNGATKSLDLPSKNYDISKLGPNRELYSSALNEIPQKTFFVPRYLNTKKEYNKKRYNSEYPTDSFRRQLTYIAIQVAWPISNYDYFLLQNKELICNDWIKSLDFSSDLKVYSTILYSEYMLPLLLLGLILLMVLISVVHLTNSYRFENNLPDQIKFKQVARKAQF